jgi:hypothetical protein
MAEKRKSDEIKRVLFLLTVHVCVNMGMFKVNVICTLGSASRTQPIRGIGGKRA